jgi:general secretion pathway protein L
MTSHSPLRSPVALLPPFPVALLRIDLPANPDWSELAWSSFDAAGQFTAHGQSAPGDLPAHERLDIALPARRVSAHPLSLPAQEKRHLDALVAQAMEDRLLGDKADALCVLGAPAGAIRTLWVCSRGWLEGELARLTAAGLTAGQVFPEYELLPLDVDATTCVATADGTIFRRPDGCVGLVDTPATVALLSGRQAVRLLPERRRLPSPRSVTQMLAAGAAQPLRFDPRRWRRSALLLAVCAILLLLGNALHWRSLERREAALQHEIRQTFATTFPGTPIIDPLLQWESKLRERAPLAGGDALDAVLTLASRLAIPLHPTRIEARDGLLRITLSDTEAAQFKTQLDGAGPPESSPAEPGFTRLQFRLAR